VRPACFVLFGHLALSPVPAPPRAPTALRRAGCVLLRLLRRHNPGNYFGRCAAFVTSVVEIGQHGR
jgi:hypothetical protein